jgi:membrane-associated protease RseP (regulator of RpoE activity)
MPWIEILLVIITAPVGLVIHELGHFVAARVLMLEVVSFQAGPFLIDWKNGESTFRFQPLLWLSAGGVRAVSVEAPAKKRILFTAAGPAASLLFSGIYWLAPVTHIDVLDEMDFLQWLVLLLAANSFVIFLLTALPLRAPPWNRQGVSTDGYKILTLIRSMNNK